ncbi:unnamed protein product [Hermetia illucens]|uniref:Reticulocalbin-3 n=2 Tax=Hermetia illucens TaxID=343691 RepID=A0A7R8UXS0_HERIL|nr:calumenin-B isoform X1 [Hermetia illucens]CAD7089059.1 unnamed protein product [Hermetia illucens]
MISTMSNQCLSWFLLFVVSSTAVLAIPKPDEKRPPEHDSANVRHYDDDHHNVQYDHEAFLGEDESKTFDQLPPEESRRRLGVIVDKIDTDKDGFVDMSELKAWIQFTQRRYIDDDVNRQWRQHNPNNSDTINWETYRKAVYGFMDEMDPSDLEKEDHGFSYKSMLTRDRRRWSVADKNGDDNLSKEEFAAFLHPEEMPQMRDVVLSETIEDIDKDNDGKVSVNEYIGDMYRSSDPEDEEPEWVKNERGVFAQYRDKDGDGYLDRDEVSEWIHPKDFDHAEAEARHLIYEADSNSDEKLTKEEILDKYDLFVGSQATDFGEALTRHDEF